GTQSDKTPEAVEAFVQIFDAMPLSEDRFAISKSSLINSFTSSRIGFRGVIDSLRAWERLNLPVDPRRERYEQSLNASSEMLSEFYSAQIKGRPKLITIVGDKSKMDVGRIEKLGTIHEITEDQIFIR
ncbi:MAG TPA: hypothetical protein PK869_10430, partial [Candidatus Hydrogenedentes bacterium]|nr:hypothetical protein [Candidatus Hydrogenedentota bacterium]